MLTQAAEVARYGEAEGGRGRNQRQKAAVSNGVQPRTERSDTGVAVDLSGNNNDDDDKSSSDDEFNIIAGGAGPRRSEDGSKSSDADDIYTGKGKGKGRGRGSGSGSGSGNGSRSGSGSESAPPAARAVVANAAGGSPSGKRSGWEKLRAAALRVVKNKTVYREMPAFLLQRVCTARRIKGQSRETNRATMANLLKGQDYAAGRNSPYFADVEGIAHGKEEFSKPKIPDWAVLALRNVLQMLPRAPRSMFKYDGVEYLQADMVKIIDAEDSNGGAPPVSKRGGRAGDGDGAGGGGGSQRGGSGKTMHCAHRMLACMVLDKHREDIIRSGAQSTRAQLDAGHVGTQHGAWFRLHETFTDPDVELPRVSTDDFVAHTDPKVLGQPDITMGKLKEMYSNLRSKFNPCYANKTGTTSGDHAPWLDFCKGSADVFLMGELVFSYPRFKQIFDQTLPEDVQVEDDGTAPSNNLGEFGDGAGTPPLKGAARRPSAKRKGRDLHDFDRVGKKKKRKKARQKEAEESAVAIGEKMMTRVAQQLPAPRATSIWTEKTEKIESEPMVLQLSASRLKLSVSRLNAHKTFSEELALLRGEDPLGTFFRARFLKSEISNLEASMLPPSTNNAENIGPGDGGGRAGGGKRAPSEAGAGEGPGICREDLVTGAASETGANSTNGEAGADVDDLESDVNDSSSDESFS